MAEDWPPTSYTDPKPYESNNKRILATAAILILPVVAIALPTLRTGTAEFLTVFLEIGNALGLGEHPYVFVLASVLAVIAWILVSGSVIIAVHEGIHYAVAALQGFNPIFGWRDHLGLKNPSIVVYAEGITRGESLLMFVSPFVLLSVLCLLTMWFASGILAGTAALMFCINAVPSCADVYNTVRVTLMPKGTLFANFDDDGDLRSEFATPPLQD